MSAFDMPQGEYTTLVDNKTKNEEALISQLVLGLAAHPLSSCNPPPKELPDLLDSLIFSERRLREQIMVIDRIGPLIAKRLTSLKQRLQILQAENGYVKVHGQMTATQADNMSAQEREMVERKQRVLQKMCLQIGFLHTVFVNRIRGATVTAVRAHHEIFDEFLGERHEHPGIQSANSKTLSCAPGCDWYQKHGPYEWSKKPYSNTWLEEMNHTDWDWVRMKQYFESVVSVQSGSGKVLSMYEMLSTNTKKFIPFWFWEENPEKWTLLAESVESAGGGTGGQIVVKIRFEKPQKLIEHEQTKKLEEMKQARDKQVRTGDVDQTADDIVLNISKTGEIVIDETFVFNNMASKPSTDSQGPQQVRWLTWWGYEQWHTEMMKHQAQKATASNGR